MIKISWIILSCFFIIQLIDARKPIKFSDLKGKNLDGKSIDYRKYKNKCVLLAQISPYISTTKQVIELNLLHDKYNSKGLQLVAISTSGLRWINKQIKNLEPKFDTYSNQNTIAINKFLKKANKYELDTSYKFLIQKDGRTVTRHSFWSFLGIFAKNEEAAKKMEKEIRECLNINEDITETPTTENYVTTDTTDQYDYTSTQKDYLTTEDTTNQYDDYTSTQKDYLTTEDTTNQYDDYTSTQKDYLTTTRF